MKDGSVAIDWENLSEKEEKRVQREISRLKALSDEALEEERKLAEVKQDKIKVWVIQEEQRLRKVKDEIWKKTEKVAEKKEEAEKPKEKAPKRFSLPKVKLIKPLPPIWKKP